jgi:uncharacterized protein YkwD
MFLAIQLNGLPNAECNLIVRRLRSSISHRWILIESQLMDSFSVNRLRSGLLLFVINIAAATQSTSAQEVDLQEAADLIIKKTNDFREANGLQPLKKNEQLHTSALDFAQFMARTGKYGHYADEQTPAQRAYAAGYEYCVVRENIAYRSDPSELDASQLSKVFTQGWRESPDHRENMLAEHVMETAVALATEDDITFYAVQLFGRPKSAAYRVVITNVSRQPWTLRMESHGDSDEIEIPPGGKLRSLRCLPVTLRLEQSTASTHITEAAELKIQTENGEPVFRPAN